VVEFERFTNGQALAGGERAALFTLSSAGNNAGFAIFDSTPGGPNDPGPDPDLLVGKGNLLILQDDAFATQTVPGIYDVPNDAGHGGTVLFRFTVPTEPRSVDLVDLDTGGGDLVVTATDRSLVCVHPDRGDGTFDPGEAYATDWGPEAVAACDLNQDGRPDLVVACSGGDSISDLLTECP